MTDRCLDRLREENSLIWPMMVSAMFRALSKALSCSDRGQRLHVLADAREQREAQQVLRQLLADIALVAEQLADQVSAGTGVVSWTLPGVSFRATISLSVLKTRCSLKPKNQPILPRWARSANTLCRLMR